ncbi:MAG: MFS transporter [Acidobacteriaceae bacterium]|nr:MFS transporter [Acidobacteriaceae bacterium]
MKPAPKPTQLQWIALFLLVISIGINYADRGNLGVAAARIGADLHFDAQHLGWLLGAFFWTYSLAQIGAGKLIDRWNVDWVYAAGFLIWSAATGLTGLVSSFYVIFFLRLVLGTGESVAYPSYSKIIAAFFPEELRGTANAAIDAGSKLGPAIGVTLGEKMIEWFSWRGMFIAIGFASLLWLIPWCIVAAKMPSRRLEAASVRAPSYHELISKRKLWGTVLGLFSGNYTWYFYLTWLPYYFEKERHYSKNMLATMASLPFWAVAISSMLFGLLADSFVRKGAEPGRVRQLFAVFGLLGCCTSMFLAILVPQPVLSNILLILASVIMGAWSSNHWAFTQRLAGAEAAGKWTAFQNCLGNFAGILAPTITGQVVYLTHSFFLAFAIACGVLLVGVIGYWLVVGEPAPVRWSKESLERAYIENDYVKPS